MIVKVFKAIVVSLAIGTIPGANAFAVARRGSLSYHGNSTIFARQSDIAPYDTDPEFNPHLNAPDVSADDLCRDTKHKEDIGNWYCQKVDQVIYSKVTKPGTYEAVTFMDNQSGACTKAPKQFSGDLAPYNEPVSRSSVIFHVLPAGYSPLLLLVVPYSPWTHASQAVLNLPSQRRRRLQPHWRIPRR